MSADAMEFAVTSIELGFEDSRGLMESLRQNGVYTVRYTNEKLGTRPDSQSLWVGSRVPFAHLQEIILLTLHHYDHIRYYSISTDFYRAPDFFHDLVVVGGLTKSALDLKILPIDPSVMTGELEIMTTKDELFDLIRSRYPDGAPIYEPETAATDPEPLPAADPIRILEFIDDSKTQNRYALSINLIVESPDEFIECMTYVKEAYISWLALRRDDAALFRFAVEAAARDHAEIDAWIKKIYKEEDQLSPLLHAVDFDVTIEDPTTDAVIHYVFEGVPRVS